MTLSRWHTVFPGSCFSSSLQEFRTIRSAEKHWQEQKHEKNSHTQKTRSQMKICGRRPAKHLDFSAIVLSMRVRDYHNNDSGIQ